MKNVHDTSTQLHYYYNLFDVINKKLFDSKLPPITLNIIPSSRPYIHYTPTGLWQQGDRNRVVNISRYVMTLPVIEHINLAVHCAVHIYNDSVLNIQDTSGNTQSYHNKYFRQAAERRGLIAIRHKKYGYSKTTANPCLLKYLFENSSTTNKL